MKYKITVELEKDTESAYGKYETIYEQIVDGDGTIVSGVVRTVLEYMTETPALNQGDILNLSKDKGADNDSIQTKS